MRLLAVLAPMALLVAAMSGCLGTIPRSQWAYDDAGLDDLADQGLTGAGVTIAILDTGINTQHPSLRHLVDDDPNNGRLVAFKDFLGNAAGVREAFDDSGHGSHVAGILAARPTSGGLLAGGVEVRGAAPKATYIVARVCDDLCDVTAIPAAIEWAVDQGADVISMSLGGQFNLTDTLQRLQIESAVNAAIDSGVVVVASAGNQGATATDVESPADIPGVIAVGAIGKDGAVSSFSSWGSATANQCRPLPVPVPIPLPLPILPVPLQLPSIVPRIPALESRCEPHQKPELVAPGENIISAWSDNGYYEASGTSQATPFVTAAVALLLQGKSDLANRAQVMAVKQALVSSAQPLEGQVSPHDNAAGYGRLDAAAALAAYR